jgi:hypothetical protein
MQKKARKSVRREASKRKQGIAYLGKRFLVVNVQSSLWLVAADTTAHCKGTSFGLKKEFETTKKSTLS